MSIRTNLHCDEIWSYGLANSYESPFFWNQDIGFLSKNNDFYNKWQDGKKWFQYITVQPNQTFAFDKVYRNQSLDLTPPFYYYILHFICSFFPNTFSLWFGQSLNIIAFIISLFFLFKLAQLLFNDKYAIAIIVFFGFSMAALNNYIYIRMYSFLTMFVIILNYLIFKIIKDGIINTKRIFLLFFIGFLGFLTQHYFAFYFFALSLSLVIYFTYNKKYSLVLKYTITTLLSFIAYFSYFPYVFNHLNHSSKIILTSHGIFGLFPFKEIFTALSFMINYTIGIEQTKLISYFRFITPFFNYLSIFINSCIILFVLFCLFYFLLRKGKINNLNIILLFEFLNVLILTSSYSSLHMNLYFGRYFFSLMPFFCILTFGFIEWFLRKIKINNKIKDYVLYFLILIFILTSHTNSAMEYCSTSKPSREEMAKLFKDSSIISVQSTVLEHTIHTKAQEYRFAKRVFPVMEYEAKEIDKAVDSITSNDKNYIIVPENNYGLLILNMLKKKGVKPRYLFTDNHPNYDQIVLEIYSNNSI